MLCCAQVYLENATGITIAGCALLAAGQSAVWMQGWAQDNTITGNLIKESGFCSVYMSGYCRASSSEDRRRLSDEDGATPAGAREPNVFLSS